MVEKNILNIQSNDKRFMEQNYAGNIIVNLASLPDFLRKPILKKRVMEFFTLSESERKEIILNALEAGPTIPFPNFSKLFGTWLEVLTTLSKEQRSEVFFAYVDEIANSPQKLINFNLDGILGIFLTLDEEKKRIISQSVRDVIERLSDERKKRVLIIMPDSARKQMNV